MKDYCTQFTSDNSTFSIIIEDDGRGCYGYLLEEGKIIADVWLYNTQETPEDMPWSEAFPLPFLNQKSYVDQKRMLKIEDENDAQVEWSFDGMNLRYADIYIREELIARLNCYAKPGWSTRVLKDGPLALLLTAENKSLTDRNEHTE
jgi:hypothetical protein